MSNMDLIKISSCFCLFEGMPAAQSHLYTVRLVVNVACFDHPLSTCAGAAAILAMGKSFLPTEGLVLIASHEHCRRAMQTADMS